MSLTLVRRGLDGAPILLAYHVGAGDIVPHVPESWHVWSAVEPSYGGFAARAPADLAHVLGDEDAPRGPLVLAGWSAGCQAVRELLRAGAEPAAVLALDGTSGEWPGPSESQMAPWVSLAARARAGELFAGITCTRQTYTEDLRAPQRPFASTLRVVSALWSQRHPLDVDLVEPGDYADGGLRVEVHDSKRCDGAAHIREVKEHGPRILRELVVPWMEGLAPMQGGQ